MISLNGIEHEHPLLSLQSLRGLSEGVVWRKKVLMGINPTAVLTIASQHVSRPQHTPKATRAAQPPHLTALFLLPADFGVSIASFHSKLTPEMENSLYSQL